MTAGEFKRHLQADINKYGISSIEVAPEDEEFLYFVDWWIVEHFTGPIKE